MAQLGLIGCGLMGMVSQKISGGVDTAVLSEVLSSGGAGGVALERLRPFIERKDASSFQFAIKNAIAVRTGTPVMPELIDILGKG